MFVSPVSTISSLSLSPRIMEDAGYYEQEVARLQTFGACYKIARETYGPISAIKQAWKASRANKQIALTTDDAYEALIAAQEERATRAWTPEKALEKLRALQTDLYYLRAPAVAMMQQHLAKIEASKEKIAALEKRFKELIPLLRDKDVQKRNSARREHKKIAKLLKVEIAHLRSLVQYTKVQKKYADSFNNQLVKEKLRKFREIYLRIYGDAAPEIAPDLDDSIFQFRTLDAIDKDLEYAASEGSEILQDLFGAERRQYPRPFRHAPPQTPKRLRDPLDDSEYTPNLDDEDDLHYDLPFHDASWQLPPPSRSQQLRSFTLIRKLDLPLDEDAPERSILRKSIAKSNILTQSALLVHKLCRDHSLFDQGEWRKDSYLTKHGATGFADLFAKVHKNGFIGTEGIVRTIGFVITDLFLHINSFFDKHGFSSTSEIVTRFKELKKSHGSFVGGIIGVLKTLSTLSSFGLSIGALTVEALFFLLSKASAAIIGALVYLLTIERVWVGLLVAGTLIGGATLYILNITAILLPLIPYGIIRYFARKNERPDYTHLTVDQRNAHVLGLPQSRHPPLHYFLNPLEVLTNKDNQTAFLDTFTRRAINYEDGFHKSSAQKFLETCTLAELKAKCDAYTPTWAGFTPQTLQDMAQFPEIDTPQKRVQILRKLHYIRLHLSHSSCTLLIANKDELKALLNQDDVSLLRLYVNTLLSPRDQELMQSIRDFSY